MIGQIRPALTFRPRRQNACDSASLRSKCLPIFGVISREYKPVDPSINGVPIFRRSFICSHQALNTRIAGLHRTRVNAALSRCPASVASVTTSTLFRCVWCRTVGFQSTGDASIHLRSSFVRDAHHGQCARSSRGGTPSPAQYKRTPATDGLVA